MEAGWGGGEGGWGMCDVQRAKNRPHQLETSVMYEPGSACKAEGIGGGKGFAEDVVDGRRGVEEEEDDDWAGGRAGVWERGGERARVRTLEKSSSRSPSSSMRCCSRRTRRIFRSLTNLRIRTIRSKPSASKLDASSLTLSPPYLGACGACQFGECKRSARGVQGECTGSARGVQGANTRMHEGDAEG